MKFCRKKLHNMDAKNGRMASGHCRKCHQMDSVAYGKNNREKARTASANWYKKNPKKVRKTRTSFVSRWNILHTSAKKRGLKVKISFERYCELITRCCHYCNRSIENETGGGLDRVDNSFGYVEENVTTCCKYCNKAKGNLSQNEFREWLFRAYNHMTGKEIL